METHVLNSLEGIAAADWNRLRGTDCPFLSHEFLSTLEAHGAVSTSTGWTPHHLLLYDRTRLVGAAPAYLKSHSWGEFVFDFAWADALERAGGAYYPKLVMGVPWTPATGPRMLYAADVDEHEVRTGLAHAARALVRDAELSSAHWLFPREADALALENAGYSARFGCQYHWRNDGYADFSAFLATLNSKKRKNIRRERNRLREAGVTFQLVHGHEVDEPLWSALHRFYVRTFRERGNVPVLTRECLMALGRKLGQRMVVVLAALDDRVIAGALLFRDSERLYGRYWGCDLEMDGLHFETCYYQGIEYCIREGLEVFESGAQGEHKLARGFRPTLTRSAHYLAHPGLRQAVDNFLIRERRAVTRYVRETTL